MNKESKILKHLIGLTKKGELKWQISKIGNTIEYKSKYTVTDKKFIKIIYIHHPKNRTSDSIIFNYFNDNDQSKKELTEVFPLNKLNVFSYWQLNSILKKVHKNIISSKSLTHQDKLTQL